MLQYTKPTKNDLKRRKVELYITFALWPGKFGWIPEVHKSKRVADLDIADSIRQNCLSYAGPIKIIVDLEPKIQDREDK